MIAASRARMLLRQEETQMRTLVVERTVAVPADAAAVHAALTQPGLRQRLAPRRLVPRFGARRASDGAGTLRIELATPSRAVPLAFDVSEPEAGFEVVEATGDRSIVRRYVLEPFALGTSTRVTSRLELAALDDRGGLERSLRELQNAELERLPAVAAEAALARALWARPARPAQAA
jgi:hypothetical protein